MKQDEPQFKAFQGSAEALAQSIGLSMNELDETMPIVYGNTGTWTLLVPVKSIDSYERMYSVNKDFPGILVGNPRSSVHPFTILGSQDDIKMYARHFSSPYSGTIEDAVTGTASGVMGAYYLTYLNREVEDASISVEQDGRDFVNVRRNHTGMDVYVSGSGVFVQEMNVLYG